MTRFSVHALILGVLQNTPLDRLQRAINALVNHTLVITLTRQSDAEIRALVKNSDGKEYGVTLTESLTACSCKDALYRGGICKHGVAVALHILRTPPPKTTAPTPQFSMFHLMWRDGIVLCGDPQPGRVQVWPWTEYMLTWPEVCSSCVAAYNYSNTAMQVEMPPPDLTLTKTRPGWGFAA